MLPFFLFSEGKYDRKGVPTYSPTVLCWTLAGDQAFLPIHRTFTPPPVQSIIFDPRFPGIHTLLLFFLFRA